MLIDLEKYLKKERQDLDVEHPDDSIIWEGIRSDLQSRKSTGLESGNKNLFRRFRNAAAILLLLLSVGYVVYDLGSNYITNRKMTLAKIDKSLGERENEYRAMVNLKREEVRSSGHINDKTIKDLFKEMQRIDKMYDQAMEDLNEIGYNEKIINTIFDTYEKKIQVLELIILETNNINNHEKEKAIFL
ncbi:MAG: hypothetical protein J7K53_06470 [Bacteroidales bacterium]|nr:hypothetical protein [Bacteroidales bacterium]